MFECERCGSSYSAGHLGVEHCPRCKLLDRVQAPLSFKALQRVESRREDAGEAPIAVAEALAPPPVEAA